VSGTIVASRSREVVIGFDQPFRVIGERINPTGRRRLTDDLLSGSFARVVAEARAQARAGAEILDVNAGVASPDPETTEPPLLARAVEAIQSALDPPLAIDSRFPRAIEAGLAVALGRPLLNSVSGEEDSLERLLPMAAKRGVPVIALCRDAAGVPADPDARFEIARHIIARAADHGIARDDVIVDPLAMPASVAGTDAGNVLRLIARLRRELRVNTVVGLSNISFGLAGRARLNAAFLKSAIAAGLTAAIMDPLGAEMAVARAARRSGARRPEMR
jgi:5-methyltetrahydrofolate--homocysteine methyltransferase